MGTPLSTCYEKRKNSDLNNYQRNADKNNSLNLKMINLNQRGRDSEKNNSNVNDSYKNPNIDNSTSLTSNSKQNNENINRKLSYVSTLTDKSDNIYKRIKFNEKENKFFIFERPQIIKSQVECNLKKLKNLSQKEIEEVNEYFHIFFAEEEKIFLENYSSIEEGFSIKAIFDEFWENFQEENKGDSIEEEKNENFPQENLEQNPIIVKLKQKKNESYKEIGKIF